ncbi:hypothetical protein [Moorena sp. SIO4G3]|nr:hypothetical protein [Moorena sp. SIO4G3]
MTFGHATRSHSRFPIPDSRFPIPDSRFPNYSGFDAVANSGNHST